MWFCPECGFGFLTGGQCPCSDSKGRTIKLIETEEEAMSNKIKFMGNTDRFCGQRKGTLLSAGLQIVKEISPELRAHVGDDSIPRGSAIRCVYIGEKGIPFVELRNYGSASLLKLQSSIGQEFTVDCPVVENRLLNLILNSQKK